MFGAGGDLTWRKLGPALYNLFLDGWLSKRFAVVGVDQKRMRDDAFRKHLLEGVDRFSRHGRTSRDANLSVAEIRRIYGLGSAENARRTTRDARKLEAISEGTSEFRRLSDDEIGRDDGESGASRSGGTVLAEVWSGPEARPAPVCGGIRRCLAAIGSACVRGFQATGPPEAAR
jgi:hypothetical protein